MKRFLLLILLMFITTTLIEAQTSTLEGIVTDITGSPLPGASVNVGNKTFKTDASGKFTSDGIGYGKTDITFVLDGYETKTMNIEVNSSSVKLGYIQVKTSVADNGNDNQGGTTLSTVESDDDIKDQNVSSLLHSANDPFVSIASYTLSAGYFRPRGYDNEYSEVLIGGLELSDPETGRPNFSDWSGLNDATRYKESSYGLNPTRFSFGALSGASDIDVRASHQPKQIKASYSYSNATYTNRVMVTASTGMMKNGWAVTVAGSTRQGNTGYVKGTFYDAWSYFLSVEKKINSKQSISFTGFGSPAKRGMQSATVQECYDLVGSNYYNPNWGLQDGKVRNAKVRNSHEPQLLLSHFYDITDKIKLTTTLGYSFGRTGTTALNWYNSADPRPDYYRYLPSWQYNNPASTPDPTVAAQITDLWKNDENTRQIDWDNLYQVNYLSALSGEQSRYIVEERRLDHSQIALASHVNYEINKHIFFTGGLNVNLYKSRNYKVMNDMLDGNGYTGYWIDIDQFAQQDFPTDSNIAQNDMNNPNRIVKKGDVFGYDYDIHINSAKLWGLGEFTYNHFDFYATLNFSGTQFWRVGNMKNGRFADDSYGKSATHSFLDYAVKAGVTYKLSGRHYFVFNTAYITTAPTFNDVYISPRIRNTVISDIRTGKIFSCDLSYIIRYPKVTARITAFNTNFQNDTKTMSFFQDDLSTYVDYIVFGINKTHQGIELGVEVKLIPVLSLEIAGSIGNYRYTNRPTAYMSVENGSQPDSTQKIYCKNFYVSGTPQTAGSIGLKFVHPKFWYANLSANIYANNWVDFNPSRRTLEALDGIYPGDERLSLITEQQKAYNNPQFTLDASVGKNIKINKVVLGISVRMTNILNNTKMVTSGFEQLRFNYTTKNLDEFPPKYFYGFGRTYFITASVKI